MIAENSRIVYFVQSGSGGPIKIGKTSGKPGNRLTGLRCGSAEELQLLGVIQDAPEILEKELHKRFSTLRVRGEWFRPDVELLHFIAEHAGPWVSTPKLPPVSVESDLPQRLRRMLDARGCSISEAARLSEMEKMHVWRIFAGKNKNPGYLTLQRLVEAVGYTMQELFSDFT
jgi:hypothetical protein